MTSDNCVIFILWPGSCHDLIIKQLNEGIPKQGTFDVCFRDIAHESIY